MAAARRIWQLQQQEEGAIVSHHDPSKYEFKILRTTRFFSFGNKNRLEQVEKEQAKFGWTLIERFDDYRLRFVRPISERKKDVNRVGDPYESLYAQARWIYVISSIILVVLFIFIVSSLISILLGPYSPRI